MTRNEALLQAIEKDLPLFHRQRMAKLQGEQMAALSAEQAKAAPDAKVIAQLRKAMVQTERNKRDVSVTEREVVQPLRKLIDLTKPPKSAPAASLATSIKRRRADRTMTTTSKRLDPCR